MSESSIATVACVGSGLIGSGWAAHFLRAGLAVRCFDPRPEAEAFLRATVEAAWPTLGKLGFSPGARLENLAFTTDLAAAVEGAGFVQESAVEDEGEKIKLLARLDAMTSDHVLIASSSSGFLAKSLRRDCRRGGRVLIGHPFNPPYLIPLVEVVGGEGADPASVARAVEFYRAIGSHPVLLRNEAPGYIGNRLQLAVWRELVYMLKEDIADIADLDAAMTHGPALRWAVAGPAHIFYLGSRTPEGHAGFVDLMVRELDEDYIAPPDFKIAPDVAKRYVEACAAEWGRHDFAGLKAARDRGVIALRQALANTSLAPASPSPGRKD
jgi:carnitine 3-dehydrogenase